MPHSDSATGASVGHVVEREVRVEDRQERDRQQRRGEQADAAVEQPRAGEVQQPHGERADDGGGDARDDEDLGRVRSRRRSTTPARPPNHDREHDVQQVRVGGRVDEVVRVPAVPEQPDRARARSARSRRRCRRTAGPARRPTGAGRARPRGRRRGRASTASARSRPLLGRLGAPRRRARARARASRARAARDGADSTADIGAVVRGRGDPGEAGHRQRVLDVLGRRDVRREALAQERLAARRVDRDAAADPCAFALGSLRAITSSTPASRTQRVSGTACGWARTPARTSARARTFGLRNSASSAACDCAAEARARCRRR